MQKTRRAWTFVDFGQKRSCQDGRAGGGHDATDCAAVDFGAIRAGSFLPMKAAGGCNTVASAYFRGRGACTQCDPKVILGAKTLYPKRDAYYGS